MRASFYHLVRSLLPDHKRQITRLSFLRLVMTKFDQVMNVLSSYRDDVRRKLNINAQNIVLQKHLNDSFDPIYRRIIIKHSNEQSLVVGLMVDGLENYLAVKLESETITDYTEIYVALIGEDKTAFDVDYIILMPVTVNTDALLVELNKYRLAGKTFTIQNI